MTLNREARVRLERSKKWLKEFAQNESGQSTIEYILILSVVVMIAIRFKKSFSAKMEGLVSNLDGEITKGIDDGAR
jgi:Flp pilus assembly pilin Flp